MNKQYEQLIADYLAGEPVDDLLIQACKGNAKLLNQLTNDVAFERIIAFAVIAKDDHAFLEDISQQLENIELLPSQINHNSHSNLNSIQTKTKLPKYLWQPLLALCASLIIAIFIDVNYLPTQPIAIVNKVVGAKSHEKTISAGLALNLGEFSLSRGYAEVTLNNGVTLLLEAPIELSIKNVDHITLRNGNLVARIPEQAIGFTIDTPSSKIIDLGTEFGVSVNKQGGSQVHVLTGEVKVRPSDNTEYEHLFENQARAFDLKSQVAIIKNNPSLFMRALPGKSIEQPEYLHWSFNQQPGNTLACDGKGINGTCYNADYKSLFDTSSEPVFSKGKFSDALYFNGTDSWLETEFSGIGGSKPRTVAFWVKTPAIFDTKYAFGILSWGLSDKLSAWQISPNPQKELGPIGTIRIGTNHAEVIGTTKLTDNHWHHVAIVLFGGEQANLSTHVLIYIDGKLEITSKKSIAKIFTQLNHPKSRPLTMGRNIAFNNPNNKQQKYRFFKGWLDEVYIFDSALNEEQILSLITKNTVN